ncbi:MAG: nucleotidyl transferase AbiEii/AbiGii toxin family protein [Bryobacteraceae bacterium]
MNRVALLPVEDRALACQEAAIRMGLASPLIIEKDFWVCWTLRQVFSLEGLPAPLFKGGTSLSKAYGLIQRFSEDVDLVLDRHTLGFSGQNDPAEQSGSNLRRRTLEALAACCARIVQDQVRPALEAKFRRELGERGWRIDPDPNDPQGLLFAYPPAVKYETGLRYLRPLVRLEFGCRGDVWPSETRRIQPYLADYFPQLFGTKDCAINVLKPERTFWEKATLLHAIFHSRKKPERQSRHYYDVSRMYRAMGDAVFADLGLLAQVVEHKKVFYRAASANYETAKPGSLRLLPGRELELALRNDWRDMQDMLFGPAPSFDEILSDLRAIENGVNRS